jgi:hypothetical protein
MFLTPNTSNFHVQYPDVNRHWSPRSERFAGGDSLMTALLRGWSIGDTVVCERFYHGGSRPVAVYHFRLKKDDREINMPVIENPYVTRLLYMSPFEVVTAENALAENDAV